MPTEEQIKAQITRDAAEHDKLPESVKRVLKRQIEDICRPSGINFTDPEPL